MIRWHCMLLLFSFAALASQCPEQLRQAQTELAAQQFARSLAAVNMCLATESGNAAARQLRGNLLYLLGKDEQAIAALEALAQDEPSNWEARYALGRIYQFNGRPVDAAKQFDAIVKAQPGHYKAWDNLGVAKEAAGQVKEAIQAHLRAIALVSKQHKDYDWAHANLADLLIRQHDERQAFDLAVEAAERNPNSARNFFLAGKALSGLEQWEKAERWLRRSAELDPTFPTPHFVLAQVYRRLKKQREAEAEERIFLQLQEKAPARLR